MTRLSTDTVQSGPAVTLRQLCDVHARNIGSTPPDKAAIRNEQATSSSRHPDSYAGVIPADNLNELVYYAYTACRHKGPAQLRHCAHSVLQSLICPCAWNEECITHAIEQELIGAKILQRSERGQSQCPSSVTASVPEYPDPGPDTERNERLDRALDEALADTFPASDPVSLSCP